MRKMMQEQLAITKDNNNVLRAIRHHQWLGTVVTAAFWILLLIAPFYLYQHYIQPFTSKFVPAGSATSTNPFGIPSSADIQKLINSFKAGK